MPQELEIKRTPNLRQARKLNSCLKLLFGVKFGKDTQIKLSSKLSSKTKTM